MSTKSTVDRIAPYATNWARVGNRSILALMQEAQDELFDTDLKNLIWIDPENEGYPPYLNTTAETYQYSITAANLVGVSSITRSIGGTDRVVRARKVLRVFIDTTSGDYDYDKRWLGAPAIYRSQNPYSQQSTRISISSVPVDSYPALEGTTAYIIFKEDPGTTTDKYFVEFAWEPPRLTSESIPLAVPRLFENALEDYVFGKIQKYENGKTNDNLTKFYGYWRTRFKKEIYSGAQANNNEVLPREM